MKNPSRFLYVALIAVMLASVSACDNGGADSAARVLLNTGATVGNGAVRQSIANYSKTIEQNPESAGAYASRGTVKLAMGDRPGAITDFTKAIELDPKSAGAYSGRGTAKYSSGDIPGATADFIHAARVMLMAMVSNGEEKSTSRSPG